MTSLNHDYYKSTLKLLSRFEVIFPNFLTMPLVLYTEHLLALCFSCQLNLTPCFIFTKHAYGTIEIVNLF